METTDLFRIVITLQNAHASLLYFLLEANEGICFYSTLSTSLEGMKLIELTFHHSTAPQVQHLLSAIEKQQFFPFHASTLEKI